MKYISILFGATFFVGAFILCSGVLPPYLPIERRDIVGDRDRLIVTYFNLGLKYGEILAFLVIGHGITLSIRQLKRILRKYNLTRRGQQSDGEDIIAAVEKELCGSGSSVGYRVMHQRLQVDHALRVNKETVRYVLKGLDPEGVDLRFKRRLRRREYSARGPDFLWHMDGYDKLKPFGFSIHGAIDGYSRRILWLKVGVTNKDPAIVASYFVEYVLRHQSTATVIRTDRGTENVLVAEIQQYLRSDQRDSFSDKKSFMYGRSVANQRIEAWWGYLRKTETNWWMNYFKDLRDSGRYSDENPVEVACLKFCYMGLIQEELNRVAFHWNLHQIRPTSHQESPAGRPDVMYFMPELTGGFSCSKLVNVEDVQSMQNMLQVRHQENSLVSHHADFSVLANLVMEDEGLDKPENHEECEALYTYLVSYFNDFA